MKSILLRRASILAVPVVIAVTWTGFAIAQGAPPPAPPAAEPAAPPPPAAPAPVKYPTTTINGYVEGAYHRTLGDTDYKQILLTRAYDVANGFQLHAAHFQLEHAATEHVAGHIEFDAGADAAINNFTHSATGLGSEFDVPQAYAKLTNSGFTFTAGKFVTYDGIEVIGGPSNPTITRGFLFFLAEPVSHVGAKLHYATGPVDVGVGLVNGWDTNGVVYTGDNNDMKTGIFRIGVTPSPMFFAAVAGTYGVEQPGATSNPRLSLDLTGAVIPNDMITINFQGNFGSEKAAPGPGAVPADGSWFGFGLQPVLKMGAAALGARFEYFKDTKGTRTLVANDPSYINVTITPGYTFDGALTVRGEFRYDTSSEEVLGVDHNKKNQSTIALGASYMF